MKTKIKKLLYVLILSCGVYFLGTMVFADYGVLLSTNSVDIADNKKSEGLSDSELDPRDPAPLDPRDPAPLDPRDPAPSNLNWIDIENTIDKKIYSGGKVKGTIIYSLKNGVRSISSPYAKHREAGSSYNIGNHVFSNLFATNGNKSYYIDLKNKKEGVYYTNFFVNVHHNNGGIKSYSGTERRFVYDKTAPKISKLNLTGSKLIDGHHYLSGSSVAKISFEIEENLTSGTVQLFINDSLITGQDISNGTGQYNFPIGTGNLNEGKNTLKIKAFDNAYNVTEDKGIEFHYDKTAPKISKLNLTGSKLIDGHHYLSGSSVAKISFEIEENLTSGTVQLFINDSLIIGQDISNGTGQYNFPIGTGNLNEGKNTLKIKAFDNAYNVAKDKSMDIYYDTIAPDVPNLTEDDIKVIFKDLSKGTLYDKKYFNMYMSGLEYSGAVVETGSGLEGIVNIFKGKDKKNESKKYSQKINGNGFTGTRNFGFFESFVNSKKLTDDPNENTEIPQGKYSIVLSLFDRVGNERIIDLKTFVKDTYGVNVKEYNIGYSKNSLINANNVTLSTSSQVGSGIVGFNEGFNITGSKNLYRYYVNKTSNIYLGLVPSSPENSVVSEFGIEDDGTTVSEFSGLSLKDIVYSKSIGNSSVYKDVYSSLSSSGSNFYLELKNLSSEGLYLPRFYTYDKAGNKSVDIFPTPYMKDSKEPIIPSNGVYIDAISGSLVAVTSLMSPSEENYSANKLKYKDAYYLRGSSGNYDLPITFKIHDFVGKLTNVSGISRISIIPKVTTDWNLTNWQPSLADVKNIYDFKNSTKNTFGNVLSTDNYKTTLRLRNDGIYKISIEVIDKVGNKKTYDLGGVFIKDTDMPAITGIKKKIDWNGSREDGRNITDVSNPKFNTQPVVYEKNGKRLQKFSFSFAGKSHGSDISKTFDERPGTKYKRYIWDNYHKSVVKTGTVLKKTIDKGDYINIGDLLGYPLNTNIEFKMYFEDEIGNNGFKKRARKTTRRTIPDFPRFELKRNGSCPDGKLCDKNGKLKEHELIENGGSKYYSLTTSDNNIKLCVDKNQITSNDLELRASISGGGKAWSQPRYQGNVTKSSPCVSIQISHGGALFYRLDLNVFFKSTHASSTETQDSRLDRTKLLKSRRTYFTVFRNAGMYGSLAEEGLFGVPVIGDHVYRNNSSKGRNISRMRFIAKYNNSSSLLNSMYVGKNKHQSGLFYDFVKNNGYANSSLLLNKDKLLGKFLWEKGKNKLSYLKTIGYTKKPGLINKNIITPKNAIYLVSNSYNGYADFSKGGLNIKSGLNSGKKISKIPSGESFQRIYIKPYIISSESSFNIGENTKEIEMNTRLSSHDYTISCNKNSKELCYFVYKFKNIPESGSKGVYRIGWSMFKNGKLSNIKSKSNSKLIEYYSPFLLDMSPPSISISASGFHGVNRQFNVRVDNVSPYPKEGNPIHGRHGTSQLITGGYLKFQAYDLTASKVVCKSSDPCYKSIQTNWAGGGARIGHNTLKITFNKGVLKNGHRYRLQYLVRDGHNNWSRYSKSFSNEKINIAQKGSRSGKSFDWGYVPQNAKSVNYSEAFDMYFRKDYKHPITDKVGEYHLDSVNYGSNSIASSKSLPDKDINNQLKEGKTINGKVKFKVEALYDYVKGWVNYNYHGTYNGTSSNSTDKESDFMKLANIDPVTNDGSVGIVFRIKKNQFSREQWYNKNDKEYTGISRLYRWIVNAEKRNTRNGWKAGDTEYGRRVNVQDAKLFPNGGVLDESKYIRDWGECNAMNFSGDIALSRLKKAISNRKSLGEGFNGDIVIQNNDGTCDVVGPGSSDNTMPCLPNFVMFGSGEDLYIVTKLIAPKTATTDSEVGFSEGSAYKIAPAFVENGINLMKHAYGEDRTTTYLDDTITTNVKIRYQTTWGAPIPPEYKSFKGFVYRDKSKCGRSTYFEKKTCNTPRAIITGDAHSRYDVSKNVQLFHSRFSKIRKKYIRFVSHDLFASNSAKRIAQIVCVRASSKPGTKLCYDLPGANNRYETNKVWIDKNNNRLFDKGIDIDLSSTYGKPGGDNAMDSHDGSGNGFCKYGKIGKSIGRTCDLRVDILFADITNVISLDVDSSWYSATCGKLYSSTSSTSNVYRILSDFQKPLKPYTSLGGNIGSLWGRNRIGRRVAAYNPAGNSIYFNFSDNYDGVNGERRAEYRPGKKWWHEYGHPDSAYLNDRKKSTYTRVYNAKDDGTYRLLFDTSKNTYPGMYKQYADIYKNGKPDNRGWHIFHWGVNSYKYNTTNTGKPEGKYKATIHYTDAPMYDNKNKEDYYFFIDNSPPKVLDIIPSHKHITDTSDWLKFYGTKEEKDEVKRYINAYWDRFYKAGTKNGGPGVVNTIFSRNDYTIKPLPGNRSRILENQLILVKDVTRINISNSKFELMYCPGSKSECSTNFSSIENKGLDFYHLAKSQDNDPMRDKSKDYRYYILYAHTSNNLYSRPGTYYLKYKICDIVGHCTEKSSQKWYYDPPNNNKIALKDLKVKYYDGSNLAQTDKNLIGMNVNDRNKFFRSDGRFIEVKTKLIQNDDKNGDGNKIVPDGTIMVIDSNSPVAIYDVNRKKVSHTNKNQFKVKNGVLHFYLKLNADNEKGGKTSIRMFAYHGLPWGHGGSGVGYTLKFQVNQIIEEVLPITIKPQAGERFNSEIFNPRHLINRADYDYRSKKIGSYSVYPSGSPSLAKTDSIYYGTKLYRSALGESLDAGKLGVRYQVVPRYTLNKGFTKTEILSNPSLIRYNSQNYLQISNKLKNAAGRYRISYDNIYKGYDYDGDGRPDYETSPLRNRMYVYGRNRNVYPELDITRDNNKAKCKTIHKDDKCSDYKVFHENKEIDMKTLTYKNGGGRVRVFADGKKGYKIHTTIKDKYGNNLYGRRPQNGYYPYIFEKDSQKLSGEGNWCFDQINPRCRGYREGIETILNKDNIKPKETSNRYDSYYIDNLTSFIPTMSGNQVVRKKISYSFNDKMGFPSPKLWNGSPSYTKDVEISIKPDLNISFYPAVYLFTQILSKDNSLRFGQSVKYLSNISKFTDVKISKLSFLNTNTYKPYKGDSRFENCISYYPFVDMAGKDTISEAVLDKKYYRYTEDVGAVNAKISPEINGLTGKNYLLFYPNLDGRISEAKNPSGSGAGLLGSIHTNVININKNDIKVKLDPSLKLDSSQDYKNYTLGGIVYWNVNDDFCRSVKDRSSLLGWFNFDTYLTYTIGNGNPIKIRAGSTKSLINTKYLDLTKLEKGKKLDKSTKNKLLDKLDESSSKSDNNIDDLTVATNPTDISGLVGGRNIINIMENTGKIKLSNKFNDNNLSSVLSEIRKNIATLYKGKKSKINHSSANLTINQIGLNPANNMGAIQCIAGPAGGEKVCYIKNKSKQDIYLEILGESYSEKITLVGEGVSFYLAKNISKTNEKAGLVIVSLRNNLGLGGTTYIDKSVTNLNIRIVSDGAVLSAEKEGGKIKMINEATTSEEETKQKLKNQLYIRGGIYARNTLGGSIYDETKSIYPYSIPTPAYIKMPEKFNNIKTTNDFNKLQSNPYGGGRLQAFKLSKTFDINYLRYYTSFYSGDTLVPKNLDSVLAGGMKFDINKQDYSEPEAGLDNPNDKFSALIIKYDPIYPGFYIFKKQ